MADENDGGGPKKPLQEDSIVARMSGGPGQLPAGVTQFVGLLARSSTPGYWLLYATLDMSRTIEVREEDIFHHEQLPPEKSPFGSLGGTRIWVRKDAKVTTRRTV